MIKVKCPNCLKEHFVENDEIGKLLTCACKCKWQAFNDELACEFLVSIMDKEKHEK